MNFICMEKNLYRDWKHFHMNGFTRRRFANNNRQMATGNSEMADSYRWRRLFVVLSSFWTGIFTTHRWTIWGMWNRVFQKDFRKIDYLLTTQGMVCNKLCAGMSLDDSSGIQIEHIYSNNILRWRNRRCCTLFRGVYSYVDVFISTSRVPAGNIAFVSLHLMNGWFFRDSVECRFGTRHIGRRGRGPPFARHSWSEWRADWLRQSRNRDRRGLSRRRNQNHWMGWKCHLSWCSICLCREWAWGCLVTWWKPKWRGSHIEMLFFDRKFVIMVFGLSFVIWPRNLLLYDCQRTFSLATFFFFI